MLAAVVEKVVHWAEQNPAQGGLASARTSFERQTGPIPVSSARDEPRIAHFLEWFVCEHRAGDEPPAVVRFAQQTAIDEPTRAVLAGLLRSVRSVFRIEGVSPAACELADLIHGARYRVEADGRASAFRQGDVFDGRIVPLGRGLMLSPGCVFHPATAHAALARLLSEATAAGVCDRGLLDPLLRMRGRLLEFSSIRAEHLYRLDALRDEQWSGPWANRAAPTTRD